jgi:hypothetical protein
MGFPFPGILMGTAKILHICDKREQITMALHVAPLSPAEREELSILVLIPLFGLVVNLVSKMRLWSVRCSGPLRRDLSSTWVPIFRLEFDGVLFVFR